MNRIVPCAALTAITLLSCARTPMPEAPFAATARWYRLSQQTQPGAQAPAPTGETPAAAAAAALPVAPWTDAPLAQREAPPALLSAWRHADNRAWCAPVAPTSLGAGEGARPRRGNMVEGGWSVEFDRPGAPGLAADGRACPRCGRAVFGIVGAALTPDEAFAPESTAAAFRDGSRVQVETPASAGEPAAATISIAGQGCVYQVWSFLGEEHLRGLVGELRFVETGRETLAMDE